ncbi:MAG: FkbM family methyltransferase [Parvibaculaceae bacterium]
MTNKWFARADIALRARRMLKNSLLGHGEIELGLLSVLVRAGAMSLDIGANKGVYTYQLQKWGRTVAFEPIPQLADKLIAADFANVTVEQCALGTEPGQATLSVPYHTKKKGALNTPSASLRAQSADEGGDGMLQIEVPVKTIDGFGFDDVGFMKIDVEGWEENVLAGARETIRRGQPTVMAELVEAYAPGALERVPAFFTEIGYEGFFIDGDAGEVRSLHEVNRAAPVNENYIFTPAHNAESFRSRCAALLRQRAR